MDTDLNSCERDEFITSEDLLDTSHKNEGNELCESVEDDSITGKSALSIYQKNKENKSSSLKKHSKQKKKKKKRQKKDSDSRNCESLMIPQYCASAIFEKQMFLDEAIKKEGNTIPDQLFILDPRCEPAFFFGKDWLGHCVGKPMNEDGHIVVFGGTGSGKTSSIAKPTLCIWKGSVFLFDFKGDLTKLAERKGAKVLNVIDKSEHYYWYDPYYFLKQDGESNLVQNAGELAQAIIPQSKDNREPFWTDAARDVLNGAIVYYFRLGVGFIDTMIAIKTTGMEELLKKIKEDKLAAMCINIDLVLNPKLLAGISAELHNRISVFATDSLVQEVLSPSENASKSLIKWEDLERESIVIRFDQSKIEQRGALIRLMLVQLIRTLGRRPEKYDLESSMIKPTLLMLDEFPQYGKIDVITSALKILRSKNVTISIFCQSLADLDETYGQDIRRTILDNCPYKVILNAFDPESQNFFSRMVGTVKVPSRGLSCNYDESGKPSGYSANITESREPIIYPEEFASLSDIVLLHPWTGGFCRIEKELGFRNSSNPKRIERRDY